MAAFDTVSFLSDYGTTDEFVGVVKSVIRTIAPDVAVIDVSHHIAPHDTRAGGLALARSVQYLAPGVVLAVVDPGVGTDRRAVAIEVGDGAAVLVGPDNGLLAPAVAMVGGATRAVALTNPDYQLPAPGATFAGRDVFAPAAAHLCNGVDLAELGDAVEPGALAPGMLPVSRQEGGLVVAEVFWVDRFGNAQLNVGPDDVAALAPPDASRGGVAAPGARVRLRLGERTRTATVAAAYAELGPGEIGLVVDSYGLLAVSLARASAAEELDLGAGAEVVIEALEATAGDDVAAGVDTPVRLGARR